MARMEWSTMLTIVIWVFNFHPTTPATIDLDVTSLQLVEKGWPGTQLNWKGYDPCGSRWQGVRCNNTDNLNSTVIELISNSGAIVGKLVPEIGSLANLQILDLSFNPQLTGTIPRTLGRLRNLQSLSLQGCGFSGSIPPELGLLKNLKFLALNKNKLSGFIPPELGGLQSVYWFDLAENNIAGPLPVSTSNPENVGLDNLTSVLHIHLFNNSLSGHLPKELSTLPKAIHLLVDNNMLTGKIPVEYGNFAKMEILRFDNNQFDGPIPSSMSQVSTLMELHASNNSFTGTLPDVSNLTKLMLLSVSLNVFDPQQFPPSLLSSKKLQTLEIERGNLIGPVPSSLIQLPSLESLSLASNTLSGTLDLSNSSMRLKSVNLNENNLTFVTGLVTQFNLSLVGNPVCTDPRLHFSDQVCSPISLPSWNTTNTTSCDLICTGTKVFNPNLCSCAFPLIVYFQFNAPTFSDINPERIDNLTLRLYNATNMAKEQLWVPYAYFIGNHRLVVPVYFFPNKTEERLKPEDVAFINNKISLHKIVGIPSEFGPYAVSSTIPPPDYKAGSKGGLGRGAIIGISVAGVAVLVAISAISIYALSQKKRADKALSKPFGSWGSISKSGRAPQLKGARYFSLHELKKATNNFSSSNEIGTGGYGKVYKGVLLSGEAVAIKKAEEGSMQGATEFKTEIELLSRVHHRNLVGLIGFCYEEGAQTLVYEYMVNGSLKDHLGQSGILNWRKRVEIALDSAKGLTYLHELANPPIIHRDIKSSNILLDEFFVAKVADFGLGKLYSIHEKAHLTTQVKGTIGYLDPEYYMTQQLSEKSDVYSFGVVMLELLTARQPVMRGKFIVREVRAALDKGGLSALVPLLDPFLDNIPDTDFKKFLDIALQCVEEVGSRRPTMSEVAKELETLLPNVVSSSGEFNREDDRKYVGTIYDDPAELSKFNDTSFAYSGGFPLRVEPK